MQGYVTLLLAPAIRAQQNQSTLRTKENKANDTTNVTRIRSHAQSGSTRNAMHIAKLFYTKEGKYSGSDDDSYEEYIDKFIAVSRALGLAQGERLQFSHNLFCGEALLFYNASVNGRAGYFPEALKMIKEQFNSPTKQQQVEAEVT